jgi:exodeoxyribonuclease-3
MLLCSWNLNSIRARWDRLVAYLSDRRPDVLCLQELKCQDDLCPAEDLLRLGYRSAFHGQRTYNGVAILAREEPADVLKGLQDGVEDPQSRIIAATVGGIRVVSVYVPNGQEVGSSAYEYKLHWLARLRRYLDLRCQPNAPLVVCGDFNVAPEDLDVYDPALWQGQTMCTDAERQGLVQVLSFGLADTFRALHPQEPCQFSWWDYRQLAFPKGHGLRIDLMLASKPLLARCAGAGIDRKERKGKLPSDHAPVWVEVVQNSLN